MLNLKKSDRIVFVSPSYGEETGKALCLITKYKGLTIPLAALTTTKIGYTQLKSRSCFEFFREYFLSSESRKQARLDYTESRKTTKQFEKHDFITIKLFVVKF